MAERQIILELEEVTKTYRSRGGVFRRGGEAVIALDRLSLAVHQGEIFGLVGESGSGKTTCGRLIVGLEQPDQGRIVVAGRELTALKGRSLRRHRSRVQMVFQDPYQSLNPQLSILDSVAEPLITNRVCPPGQRRERVARALQAVGLTPPELYLYRFPHQLSGGQRQRVAIARAMILKPACLVADEPTSMLDASYSAQIFEILLGVRRELGTTIVFITHSLAAARYLCDRVAVIYRGQLMELGPAGQVIENPRHPYTQALLDATPSFGRGADYRRHHTLLAAERPAGRGVGCSFFPRCRPARRSRCSLQRPQWVPVEQEHLVACHLVGSA